jgi:ribosomal protein L16 Arg81 hydroxylase
MRIVNPSFGIQPAGGGETAAAQQVDWLHDPILLFGNNKPNARELLEGVRQKLASRRRIDNVEYLHKNSASQPAPVAMIEAVAQKYRAALLALGD